MAIPLITAADVGRKFYNRDGDLCEIIVAGNPQRKQEIKYENLSNGRTYWIGNGGKFHGNGSYNRCPLDFDRWEGEESLTYIQEQALEKGFPLDSAIVKIATELRDWKKWELIPNLPEFSSGNILSITNADKQLTLSFRHRQKDIFIKIPNNGSFFYKADITRDRVLTEFKLFSKGTEIKFSVEQLVFLYDVSIKEDPMYWEIRRWYEENMYQPSEKTLQAKKLQESSVLDEQLAGVF